MIRKLFLLSIVVVIFSSCGGRSDVSTSSIGTECYYCEQYRPQFHFSPEKAWMNDPNGMVWYDGEYHLFYQYYPDSTIWGPMHWGHAVSTDLVHWRHLPVALFPDTLGYIFSGSAVADINNSSGLGTPGNPPIVAIFTHHDPAGERSGSNTYENQSIAYSTDRGRSWTKYTGNPVLKNPGKRDFRDPKVTWHKETSRWIMVLAVHDRVHFYSSPDLKNWSLESEFGTDAGAHGGVWECPDLFRITVEGTNEEKWVLIVNINPGGPNGGSATQYFTGSFDGHSFVPDTTAVKWIDHGRDNYAGVTWSGVPADDGRRLYIGWMSNWNYANVVPTKVWRSANTTVRELVLTRDEGDYVLRSSPVRELQSLRDKEKNTRLKKKVIKGDEIIDCSRISLMQSDLSFSFDLSGSNADTLGIVLENNKNDLFKAGYATKQKDFFIDRNSSGDAGFSKHFPGIATAPYSSGSRLTMRLIIDASSVEIFVDDGKLVMTTIVFPGEPFSKLRLFSSNGKVILESGELYSLKRIW